MTSLSSASSDAFYHRANQEPPTISTSLGILVRVLRMSQSRMTAAHIKRPIIITEIRATFQVFPNQFSIPSMKLLMDGVSPKCPMSSWASKSIISVSSSTVIESTLLLRASRFRNKAKMSAPQRNVSKKIAKRASIPKSVSQVNSASIRKAVNQVEHASLQVDDQLVVASVVASKVTHMHLLLHVA